VLGQDFFGSSGPGGLTCILRSLASQVEAGQWLVEARPVSDKLLECRLDRQRSPSGLNTILSAPLPIIFEVRVANNDELLSNEVFLTLYNSSCSECPEGRMPQHPTVCPDRKDICYLDEAQNGGSACFPATAIHPDQPCLQCMDGQWQQISVIDKNEDVRLFSKHHVELHSQHGDHVVYSLPLAQPSRSADDIQLILKRAPGQMRLTGSQLEWVAQTSHEDSPEVVEVLVEARAGKCREPEDLVIRLTMEQCRCLNGGWCVKGGSSGVERGCECPHGYSGTVFE
jgi:hypothetical protein